MESANYLYMIFGEPASEFDGLHFMRTIMWYHGIIYREKDFGNSKVAGMLTRRRDIWVIVVNSRLQSSTQKLFTIAHELGHYFCHRDNETGFFDDTGSLTDRVPEEQEANVFASELLVPKCVLEDLLSAGYGFSQIAEKIGLSKSSLHWRLVRYVRYKYNYSNEQAIEAVRKFTTVSDGPPQTMRRAW